MLDKALINYRRYIKEVGYFHFFQVFGKGWLTPGFVHVESCIEMSRGPYDG
jgi:hypothetical protein